jgi:hypothetical protein
MNRPTSYSRQTAEPQGDFIVEMATFLVLRMELPFDFTENPATPPQLLGIAF